MKCRHCGEEFDGHGNAKYCPDCKKIVQREQQRQRRSYAKLHQPLKTPKTCAFCGKEFEPTTYNAKYCTDCRSKAQAEYNRSYHKNHRRQRPKPVAKPVEKLRPLTKDDVARLMKLIRDAYYAGELILHFGGQSALTGEQFAVVEQKYPDHKQNLGDLRNQKFFDAADKFIEAYQAFK